MKKGICALLAALMACMLACSARAQIKINVYAAQDAMDSALAGQLTARMQQAMPQAEFVLLAQAETGHSLRDLILMDCAPGIAICSPGEALAWAKEGLLLPMDACIAERARMEPAVLRACRHEGRLFMAPLLARHRSMAVNRGMLEAVGLGHLLDRMEYPVWLTVQIRQVMEEFALADMTAFELWRPQPQDSAAIEALAQAIYGGLFMKPDGQAGLREDAAQMGVVWLEGMLDMQQIGLCKSRAQALEHFLDGEVPIFIDWTEREARALEEKGGALDIETMPYPTTNGQTIRSFEVTGAAVLRSGNAQADALAQKAVAFLMADAQAQRLLGARGIFQDGALWLEDLGASERGMLLRSALCDALTAVFDARMDAETAMRAAAALLGE